MEKLVSIQYLRAVAVILVVYCHALDLQMHFGQSHQQNFLFIQNIGAIGVDIFFVISGFVISYISQSYNEGFKSAFVFIKKRFVRINPVYYFVTIIYLVTSFKFNYAAMIKSITILPVFELGSVFCNPILAIGWTLSFEYLFYLFYFFSILFAPLYKDYFLIFIVVILFFLGSVCEFNVVQWNFITNPLIMEFAFGVVLSLLYKKINISLFVSYFFLILGICLFLYNVFYGYGDIHNSELVVNVREQSLKRVMNWGATSFFILLGFLFLEKNRKIKLNKYFYFLGNSSFSIYLIHPLIFRVSLFKFFFSKYCHSLIFMDFFVIFLCMIAIVIGGLFYLFFEKKIVKLFTEIVFANVGKI